MHFVKAPSRARRALCVLAVTGLALTGVAFSAAQPASAGPLAVTGLTATDLDNQPASFVWTTEPVTLTVTANANVGGDTLRVIDSDTHTVLGSPCMNVQSCPVSGITFNTPGEHEFEGQLLVGGHVVSTWDTGVTWADMPVTLQASQTTVPVGQSVTFTATTSRDIGPSDWVIEIVDLTAGTLVCESPSGTTCAPRPRTPVSSVTENVPTTHEFAAFITTGADKPSGLTGIRSESPHWFVTWSNDGWQVSLTATPQTTINGEATTITATANMAFGPTPFCIDVFDENTGQAIGGSPFTDTIPPGGTSRSFAFNAVINVGNNLVAFVARCGTTLPPSGIEASSSVVFTNTIDG